MEAAWRRAVRKFTLAITRDITLDGVDATLVVIEDQCLGTYREPLLGWLLEMEKG